MKNEPRIPITFSLPSKDKWLLEYFDVHAKMERGNRTRLIRQAMLEYANRHREGNPQKPLVREATTSPIARIEAGIRFLRTHNKLSYKQIARITYISFRQVHKIACDGKKVKRRKLKGSLLESYRQKWELFKRGLSPEEAFRF